MKSLHQMALGACSTAALLLLAACSGSSESGIETSIKALPLSAAHTHGAAAASTGIEAKHGDEESVVFRRGDGVKIELQLGLLNLVPVELVSCDASLASALQKLGDDLNPVPAAYAHGGVEGEAPEGAVSVVGSEETSLGTLKAKPGQYCGIVVELEPGAAAVIPKHGGEIDTSMAGASINVAPCYYLGAAGLSDEAAEAVTAHACIQAKFTGASRELTLPFTTPVTLDKDHRDIEITVATRYEEWFDNIDFSKLASDTVEQAKLADNVAGSLQAVTGDEQLVNLAFQIKVKGEEAVCGKVYQGLGTTQQPLRVEGFRFYAGDFELKNATGSQKVHLAEKPNSTVYQDDAHNVAIIGHAQGCDSPAQLRNLTLSGTVKKGEYDKICFDLGVPYELNHSNVATAPSPLNITGMDWSWLFGRMQFRFDSVVGASVNNAGPSDPHGGGASADVQTFFVHLGSTGCSNGASDDFGAAPTAACEFPNRPRICLDYSEIEEGHPIVADIAPVISELDITVNTPDTAPGCMSFPGDPECVTIMPKLGVDFFLNESSTIPKREQALFTVGE